MRARSHVELEWAKSAAHDLRRQIVHALGELADLEQDPAGAALHLEHANDLDPTDQSIVRRLIRLYAEQQRQTAVRQCYEQLQERLRERGARPDAQTTRLCESLLSEE